MIIPQTYIRIPVPVKALQVTAENMEELEEWCGGEIMSTEPKNGKAPRDFIKVPVTKPQDDRTTKAFVGDWIVHLKGHGFKVFLDKPFRKYYERREDLDETEPPVEVEESSEEEIEDVPQALAKVVSEFNQFGNQLIALTERLNREQPSSGRG